MRLIDQILISPADNVYRKYTTLHERLARAAPFEIDEKVRLVTDTILQSDLARLNDARRFARLPFPDTWFEWVIEPNQDPEPSTKSEMWKQYKDLIVTTCEAPTRLGVLVSEGRDPQTGIIHFAMGDGHVHIINCVATMFDFRDEPEEVPDYRAVVLKENRREQLAQIADHSSRQYNFEAELTRWGQVPSPLFEGYFDMLESQEYGESLVKQQILQGIFDTVGEGLFIEGLLIAINAKNLTQTISSPPMERLNRRRRTMGRPPLASVSRIVIRLNGAVSRADKSGDPESNANLRAHIVRGHFKVRRTGVFWWSPFVRGSATTGDQPTASYTVRA